jgi:hypothetical protein
MTLCVLPSCRTQADVEPGAMTCAACREHLTRQLGEIESYLTIVTAAPSRSGDFGPHRPGFASTPPVRLDVVAMLDPRTELNGFGPDDILDEVPNIGEDLAGWWRVVQGEHDYHLVGGGQGMLVTAAVAVDLRTYIGWICRQAWVDGFAADIQRVHGALARACGDSPAKALGVCLDLACGGQVFRRSDDPRDGRLQCRKCSTTYSGLDLVKLRSADV